MPSLRIEILLWNTTDIVLDEMNRSQDCKSLLLYNRVHFCRTSKMSHDHSRHGSCSLPLLSRPLHSIKLSSARDMTAVVVGSGALLATLITFCTASIRR